MTPARPLAVDVCCVFDAGAFDLDQVVAYAVPDIDVRVVGVLCWVGLLACQVLKVGHVLVLAGVRSVCERGWRVVAVERDGHVGHFFEEGAHRFVGVVGWDNSASVVGEIAVICWQGGDMVMFVVHIFDYTAVLSAACTCL